MADTDTTLVIMVTIVVVSDIFALTQDNIPNEVVLQIERIHTLFERRQVTPGSDPTEVLVRRAHDGSA